MNTSSDNEQGSQEVLLTSNNGNFRLLYMMEYRGGYVRKICTNLRPNQKILQIELNFGNLWKDNYIEIVKIILASLKHSEKILYYELQKEYSNFYLQF